MNTLTVVQEWTWQFWLGFVLAMAAAGITALTGFSWVWSHRMMDGPHLIDMGASKFAEWEHELFFLLVALVVTNLIAVALNQLVGRVWGAYSGELISWDVFALAAMGGVISYGVASVAWRIATSLTADLGIHALSYATPIFSLLFLFAAGQIVGVHWEYLVIGTAAIVVANLLINFEAERLVGFKTLVISLWVCGTVVYLRSTDSWGWAAKSDGYFDVLFLSATVFALILSFRTVRLAARTQDEDNRAFKLFRELEELERRRVMTPMISANVLIIDEKHGSELGDAYGRARRGLSDALRGSFAPDREKLVALAIELDALAHSRQQGINFGEICALFIFAGLVLSQTCFRWWCESVTDRAMLVGRQC